MTNLTDKQARDIIFTELNKNLFVEAGAGSGKTTSLVQRMVNLIKYGIVKDGKTINVETSEICTITFTKVAANEFKTRFQAKLYEELNNTNDEAIKQRLLKAISDIDLAFMGTIDAFCKKLIDEDPLSANVPYSSQIVDDKTFGVQIERLFNDLNKKKYKGQVIQDKFNDFVALFSDPKKVFVRAMTEVCDNVECKLKYKKPKFIRTIDEEFATQIETANQLLNVIKPGCFKENVSIIDLNKTLRGVHILKNKTKKNWHSCIKQLDNIIKDIKSPNLLPDAFENISTINGYEYFVVETAKTKKISFEKFLKDIQDYKYSIAMDCINDCYEMFLLMQRNKGNLRFVDNLVYCRDMLKNDALTSEHKLINRLQKKYKYFFLDEFQDTDPVQIQVFFYLAAEKIDEDWKKCIPFDGSLFIVGDPKQSIYKFKGADIISYSNIKNIFEELSKINKGEVIELTKNFRSRNSLLTYFNETFTNLLNGENNQCSFASIPLKEHEQTFNDEKILEGAYIISQASKDKVFTDLASLVKNIKDNYKIIRTKVIKKEDDSREFVDYVDNINYSDFMIITPSKTKIPLVVKSFNEHNIPNDIRGIINFSECELLLNIYNILKYIIEPKDVNKTAVLYSSLFNLTPNDVYNILINKDSSYDYINTFFEDVYKIIRENPIRFSVILDKLSQNEYIISHSNLKDYNSFHFILEYVKEMEAEGEICTINDMIDFIESAIKGEFKEDFKQNLSFSKDNDRVMIANIHQVKGAEASICILACEGTQRRDSERYLDFDNKEKYLFKVSERNGSISTTYLKCNYYKEEQLLDNLLSENEVKRNEYVAATRAKNVLIIYPNPKASVKAYKDLYSNSELRDLSKLLNYEKFDNSAEEKFDYESINVSKFSKENEIKTYKTINPSKEVVKPIMSDDHISGTDVIRINYNAAQAGSLVHRMCELIVLSNNSIDKDVLIDSVLEEYKISLENYMTYEFVLENAYNLYVKNSESILYKLLNAEEVYCEVPFSYKEGIDIVQGYIDVIYKENGKYHIIDYKTNRNTENLDEEYENQLNLYIKAAKICLGIDCDAKTYSIPIKDYYEN